MKWKMSWTSRVPICSHTNVRGVGRELTQGRRELTFGACELAVLLTSGDSAVHETGEHIITDVTKVVVGLDELLDSMAARMRGRVSRHSLSPVVTWRPPT